MSSHPFPYGKLGVLLQKLNPKSLITPNVHVVSSSLLSGPSCRTPGAALALTMQHQRAPHPSVTQDLNNLKSMAINSPEYKSQS